MEISPKQLAEQIETVPWHCLRPHAEREALVLVAAELDLAAVGVAVAVDDAAQVRQWLQSGQVAKPTSSQIEEFGADPGCPWRSLIVQPFVLIQAVADPAAAANPE